MAGQKVNSTAPKFNFWLIKVPNVLEDKWQMATEAARIRDIRVFRRGFQSPAEASFILNKELQGILGVGSYVPRAPRQQPFTRQSPAGNSSAEGNPEKKVHPRPTKEKDDPRLKKPREERDRRDERLGLNDHPKARYRPVTSQEQQVPRFLEEQWKVARDAAKTGKLQFKRKSPQSPAEASFILNKELQGILGVGSYVPRAPRQQPFTRQSPAGKSSAEGETKKKVRPRPTKEKDDPRLKKPREERDRRAEGLKDQQKARPKPVASQEQQQDAKRKKKVEGKKVKGKAGAVLDMLFAAFDEKSNISTKELIKTTKQPRDHLKKFLKEIAEYNVDGSPEHTWQLKPNLKLKIVEKN